MSRNTWIIIIIVAFALSSPLAYYPLWGGAQEKPELIQLHRDAETNGAICTSCHGSRTDEVSLEPDIKPVHTLHLTNPLLNLECVSCHKSVDLVDKSAAHLRRQVSMSVCTTCHAEFFRKPLKVVPPERVAVLTLEAGYNEFSLPFDYVGIDAMQALEIDASQIRLLATAVGVTSPPDYIVYPQAPADQFHAGRGYQISLYSPATIFIKGEVVTKLQTPVSLQKGWNMIGQPYLSSVSWDSVRLQTTSGAEFSVEQAQRAGIISKALWIYDRTTDDYKQAKTLEPYKAYWIQANEDATLLIPKP